MVLLIFRQKFPLSDLKNVSFFNFRNGILTYLDLLIYEQYELLLSTGRNVLHWAAEVSLCEIQRTRRPFVHIFGDGPLFLFCPEWLASHIFSFNRIS